MGEGGVLRAFKALLLAMAWFVLMAEEGVECFKDFSFLSEQVAEVGVIIHWHSTVHTHNINDHAIPLFFPFSPPFITSSLAFRFAFIVLLISTYLAQFVLFYLIHPY